MQIILLERVENLGQMGDTVEVKPGYARNFLLPRKKALRATKDNIAYFESQKKNLEAENAKKKKDAESLAKKVEKIEAVTLVRAASEAGKLYGSVSARDIANAITEAGVSVDRQQITLLDALKNLGLFPIKVTLHPEVIVEVTVNIARTEEEAKIQLERGHALVSTNDQGAPTAASAPAEVEAEKLFENPEDADADVETTDAKVDTEQANDDDTDDAEKASA